MTLAWRTQLPEDGKTVTHMLFCNSRCLPRAAPQTWHGSPGGVAMANPTSLNMVCFPREGAQRRSTQCCHNGNWLSTVSLLILNPSQTSRGLFSLARESRRLSPLPPRFLQTGSQDNSHSTRHKRRLQLAFLIVETKCYG